ncbi:MAG: hypothetical protein V3V10_10725 [Planctomycetota bacterium]
MTMRIMHFILAMALGGLFAASLLAPPYSSMPMPSFAEVTGPMTVSGIGSNDPASSENSDIMQLIVGSSRSTQTAPSCVDVKGWCPVGLISYLSNFMLIKSAPD